VEEGEIKEKVEKASKSTISRRDFLKDAGLIVGGATVGSMAVLSACSGETVTNTVTTTKTVSTGGTSTVTVTVTPTGQVASSGVKTIKVNVNGWDEELTATPTDTLRDVLRDQLGLISIKDMCNGWGACGSCSVIMNGRPILSCMTLAIECDGVTIETAEGVAKSKPELIDAYVMNYCMQCGYCTPGFVVTAKALLDHNPNPTDEVIRHAFGGNICRCGPYPQHVAAVKSLIG
jgi:aerobic-type carbon monoxide dehydrogenase small subunit (CoxS/CutS family)